MATINLLYATEYAINDKIKVRIPTVGEVIDNEDDYYNLVNIFTAMPIDFMVMLDDNGIDFSDITPFELFLLLFGTIKNMNTDLIFDGLDLSKFVLLKNEQNGEPVLVDMIDDIKIDKLIHERIASTLRYIHNMEKDTRKPANKEAKEFMLDRARKKAERNKRRIKHSQIEQLVVAMVNTQQYKYDYEGTRNLTIYQFNESVRQVGKKVNYENIMHGVYSGTLDVKSLKKDDLNWIAHK